MQHVHLNAYILTHLPANLPTYLSTYIRYLNTYPYLLPITTYTYIYLPIPTYTSRSHSAPGPPEASRSRPSAPWAPGPPASPGARRGRSEPEHRAQGAHRASLGGASLGVLGFLKPNICICTCICNMQIHEDRYV